MSDQGNGGSGAASNGDNGGFWQAYHALNARLHAGANQHRPVDAWAAYGETPWWSQPSTTNDATLAVQANQEAAKETAQVATQSASTAEPAVASTGGEEPVQKALSAGLQELQGVTESLEKSLTGNAKGAKIEVSSQKYDALMKSMEEATDKGAHSLFFGEPEFGEHAEKLARKYASVHEQRGYATKVSRKKAATDTVGGWNVRVLEKAVETDLHKSLIARTLPTGVGERTWAESEASVEPATMAKAIDYLVTNTQAAGYRPK